MTKVTWIIAAVIVIGGGIAAGLIFVEGTRPTAIAAIDSAKETGTEPSTSAATFSQTAPETPAVSAADPITGSVVSSASASGPRAIVTLDELIATASSLAGTEVILRGTIVTQCIAGCQFSLEDGTGVIGVELVDDALDNVLSRGSVGRKVEVQGVVELSPTLRIVVDKSNGWRYLK